MDVFEQFPGHEGQFVPAGRQPGAAAHRTDMAAELTPYEARAAALALLERADTADRASEQDAAVAGRPAHRASGGELLAGILQMRIERWLELEGVLDIPGFGDVELAGHPEEAKTALQREQDRTAELRRGKLAVCDRTDALLPGG